MRFVRRTQWGAPATSPAAFIQSTKGTKVHYLGSAYSSRSHALCDDMVRQVRDAHLNHPIEDYVDIAYNLVACEHGYVFEGRGAHKRSGANGSYNLNTGHYSILALLGSSGMIKPNDLMLHALRDGIDWLRAIGGAGPSVQGHRDGHPTECPGDPLYAWVTAGARRPQEDEMPTAKETADAVWTTDNVETLKSGDPDNPFYSAGFMLSDVRNRVKDVQRELGELPGPELSDADVAAIADRLGANEAFITRLADEIAQRMEN